MESSIPIELIKNIPCLEHLFLLILDSKKISNKSQECKKIFEAGYINKKQRAETHEYDKCFTKELLEQQRVNIKILDDIIKIMEGK